MNVSRPVVSALLVLSAISCTLSERVFGVGVFRVELALLAEQPWRLATSALVHSNSLHLALNVAGIWYFGRVLEARMGSLRFAVFVLFLLLGSMSAQVFLDRPAIGLSGVWYGLFGYCFVIDHYESMDEVIDESVSLLAWGWLLLCVVTTYAGVFRVGNIGHFSGVCLGMSSAYVAHSFGGSAATARARKEHSPK